jgi:hypothetical protein
MARMGYLLLKEVKAMEKTGTVRARIEPVLKEDVEKVFKDTDAKRNLIRCENADDMFDKLGI